MVQRKQQSPSVDVNCKNDIGSNRIYFVHFLGGLPHHDIAWDSLKVQGGYEWRTSIKITN